jgi:hypothetical protein
MADAVPPPVPAASPARRSWLAAAKAVLATVAIFTLVGPVVGYFALMLPVGATSIGGVEGVFQGLLAVVVMMPFGVPFAYFVAYLPAALTGLALAMLDLVVDLRTYRIAVAILLGAGITLALVHRVSGEGTEFGSFDGIVPFAAVAAATGGIAAAVCALLAPRRAASALKP